MSKNNDGWEKVGDNQGPAWKPEKEGDETSGIFVDMKSNVGPNSSKLYTLQQPDGTFVGVWGSAVIDDRMVLIPLGDEVRIVYLGKVPSKTPGRTDYKQFEIFRKAAAKTDAPATETPAVEDLENDDIPF